MEYQGLTYPEAIRALAETVGMPVPETRTRQAKASDAQAPGLGARMLEALNYYRAELKKSKGAIDYLKGRGLSGEIAARYGLGYAPDGWQNLEAVFPDYATGPLKDTGLVIDSDPGEGSEKKSRRYDRFRNRVMFPILDGRGNVIGFGGRVIGEGEPKYLNSPETPLFEKGRELYGLRIRRAAPSAMPTRYSSSRATWTWWRWPSTGSRTRSPRSGPPPPAPPRQAAAPRGQRGVLLRRMRQRGPRRRRRALEVSCRAGGRQGGELPVPAARGRPGHVRAARRRPSRRRSPPAAVAVPVRRAAAGVDMESEEGRARFVAQAKPLCPDRGPALGRCCAAAWPSWRTFRRASSRR
jgi:DNA primase